MLNRVGIRLMGGILARTVMRRFAFGVTRVHGRSDRRGEIGEANLQLLGGGSDVSPRSTQSLLVNLLQAADVVQLFHGRLCFGFRGSARLPAVRVAARTKGCWSY